MIKKTVFPSITTILACSALATVVVAAGPSHTSHPPLGAQLTARGASPTPSSGDHRRHRHAEDMIEFETMYGVDGPFLGDANEVRGVEGDEAPWAVESVRGSLDTDGRLRIRVRGLVFKDDPSVPPDLVGTNDEAEFRGLVSCLTEGDGTTPSVNVVTQGFPATTSGDSNIDAVVSLPNPCIAPIVMVLAGSEDKWFAITGFEAEGD
jgi:hypothetical protein